MVEKCEFCEKLDFENVNFVKIEDLDFWIKCEFMRYAPVCALELSIALLYYSIMR